MMCFLHLVWKLSIDTLRCPSHRGSKALFAACVFLAAASRQRIGRSSRHAEEGDARSNSEKGNRKNHSEKALTDEVVEARVGLQTFCRGMLVVPQASWFEKSEAMYYEHL